MLHKPEIDYEARQAWVPNVGPVTVIKYRAEGFTKELWQKWKDDPISVQCALNDRMTARQIYIKDEYKSFHIHMKMPMLISNRSILTTFYHQVNESENTEIVVHSSQGNEFMVRDEKHNIGKDVIANMIITFTKGVFYETGTELTQVLSLDVAGKIPDFIKRKIAAKFATTTLDIVNYMKEGTIPEKIF